jgi:phosphoglycerol geranylgeranyltransferase
MRSDKFPGGKSIALLLDPDKARGDSLYQILKVAANCNTDYIMAGGSLTFNSIDNLIDTVREYCSIPVILFPGNLLQLSHKADTILLLSLISGRNPELLIGNHVIAAPYLKDIREKLISVGYILISCGSRTSVEYISQTEAIPSDKSDIIVATAIAGEMLGLNMIYLEAGSGALSPVPDPVIRSVREDIFSAGADLIILGNGCEKYPDLLADACAVRDKIRIT